MGSCYSAVVWQKSRKDQRFKVVEIKFQFGDWGQAGDARFTGSAISADYAAYASTSAATSACPAKFATNGASKIFLSVLLLCNLQFA